MKANNILIGLCCLLTIGFCFCNDTPKTKVHIDNYSDTIINQPTKRTSDYIFTDSPRIEVNATLAVKSRKEVMVTIQYKNTNLQDVLIPKSLIAFDNKISNDIFGITPVAFSEKEYPEYYGGKIIDSNYNSENVVILKPLQIISSTINLADFYNFSNYKRKKMNFYFTIYRGSLIPLISNSYKLEYGLDSVDGKMKPIKFLADFPESKDIDSMRRYFILPPQ